MERSKEDEGPAPRTVKQVRGARVLRGRGGDAPERHQMCCMMADGHVGAPLGDSPERMQRLEDLARAGHFVRSEAADAAIVRLLEASYSAAPGAVSLGNFTAAGMAHLLAALRRWMGAAPELSTPVTRAELERMSAHARDHGAHAEDVRALTVLHAHHADLASLSRSGVNSPYPGIDDQSLEVASIFGVLRQGA